MVSSDIVQVEIRNRDIARAASFYEHAMGWLVVESGDTGYRVALTGLRPIVGLQQTPHERVPVTSVPFVGVDDAIASAEAVKELGGRVIISGAKAGAAGTWSMTMDPWGNELGFWQSSPDWNPTLGADVVHPVAWVEIAAPDLAAAVRYYRRACGWTFQVSPEVDDFAFFQKKGAVGIGLVSGERGARLSKTTVYLATPDLEASVAAALAAGATLRVEPTVGPEGGTFAVINDPEGIPIGFFQDLAIRVTAE